MDNQQVILVDEHDNALGAMDKMEAHQKGLIHRAFSIFIFNSRGEMLLQQRALNKYHSAGLWSNSCCSHPLPGEEVKEAATRRLNEELGFETSLEKIFDFIYRVSFENGLVENEFDHVFVGHYDGKVKMNSEEVNDYVFKPMEQIGLELKNKPENYTEWFKISFPKIEAWWQQNFAISNTVLNPPHQLSWSNCKNSLFTAFNKLKIWAASIANNTTSANNTNQGKFILGIITCSNFS